MRESARRSTDRLPPHRVSPEYIELSAARAWGLTPAYWRGQSADDRARMIAQVQFEATYKGWAEDHLLKKSHERSAESSSENPIFRRMKDRLRSSN